VFRTKQWLYDRSKRTLSARQRHVLKLRLIHARQRIAPRARPLPDFVIVGAMRAGTSSLYKYLDSHPETAASLRKEVGYFSPNFGLGEAWYRSHFPARRPFVTPRVAFEATPHYLSDPCVPERLRATLPDAKIVVVLREPIERAASDHNLWVNLGVETRSFAQAIEEELDDWKAEPHALARDEYLARSLYGEQLERWSRHVPAANIGVFYFEDLRAHRVSCLTEIARFVGISEHGFGETDRNFSRFTDRPAPRVAADELPPGAIDVLRRDRERLHGALSVLGDRASPPWPRLDGR
jgi:hypothetical protein